MKFPVDIPVAGDKSYRRKDCPSERAEQITLVAEVRRLYPDSIGPLIFHVQNEGKRDYRRAAVDKATGLTPGVPDIVIPGDPCIMLEIKRQDHTKSRLPAVELAYLRAAQKNGAVVAICLGWKAGLAFVQEFVQ